MTTHSKRRARAIRAQRRKDLVTRSQRAVRWLQPGLVVKRWLLTSGLGLMMALLGAAVWADLKPIYWIIETLSWMLSTITTVLPREITGPLVVIVGIGLVLWGQSRSFGSIQQALAPDKDTVLVDALRAKSRLNRGPNIVAIGGGTGLSTLLSGLKRYSSHITAIVTVADDGGSSGVLRRELGVLPPGDIRNCLAALSTEEPLLTRLFQYRFAAGSGLEGHSFGNLFLSALTAITGNLETAITASSRVLGCSGPGGACHQCRCEALGGVGERRADRGGKQHRQGTKPDRSARLSAGTPAGSSPRSRSDRQRRSDPSGPRQPLHLAASQSAGSGADVGHPVIPLAKALHLQSDDPARRDRRSGCGVVISGRSKPSWQASASTTDCSRLCWLKTTWNPPHWSSITEPAVRNRSVAMRSDCGRRAMTSPWPPSRGHDRPRLSGTIRAISLWL